MKIINKKALKFALYMLPVGILAGILTSMLSFSSFDNEMTKQVLGQMPKTVFFLITGLQTGFIYTGLMGYFGYILANRINLMKKLSFDKRSLLVTLVIGLVGGLLMLFDYFTFAKVIPQVAASYTKEAYSMLRLSASVIYGGIVEEIMLRWFFMSLFAFTLWKVFDRHKEKEHISKWVYIAANISSAMLFAAGHLPATIASFGGLSGIIIFRCFLLNGGLGIIFGWLYRKNGLQYAMIAHAMAHIVPFIIFSIIL